MKINEPVTNHEIVMEDDQFLVSTTDLKGIITSANRAFVEISGFTLDELMGRNHNIVRHPDMPPEAFEDLWRTLKEDRPWTGLVKNRTKNGDYYWVRANITPLREHGQVTGYMSVRTKPSREEITQAEAFYRDVRAGKARFKPGPVKRIRHWFANLGVSRYLYLMAFLSLPLMGFVAWLARSGASPLVIDTTIGAITLSIIGFILLLNRYIRKPLDTAIHALQEIASGNYFEWVSCQRNDDLGRMLHNVQSTQIRLGYQVNEMMRQSNEMSRIKEALDNAGANVMIADEDFNIIYLNKAAEQLMKNAEAAIRKELPEFDADHLLGASIDQFHRNPAHQRSVLEHLDHTHVANFTIGGRTLRITANPIVNGEGKRIGTVVEWLDRTEEVAVEDEIQSIVDAALMGNLTERIETAGKEGFFANLSRSVNELMSVLEKVVDETADVIGAMARGDLSRQIESEYEGSFGRLRDDVNATIANLTKVLGSIRESADAVEEASREIAEGNTDLARRTEMQASNLEQTASSMEEITSTVRQNAENSRKASELSQDTLEDALQGGEVVHETIGAMEKITEASKKIAAIIGVIDDIAFQTNLLALNAAVEAARAGEQGRGFAVVATEVRNLAQRSATAAKEIKDLIEDSVSKVEQGSQLVDQSGKTLQEIVESVKKVNDFIAEIAAASSEQYAGIDQVNQAVTQMDEVTQQNAALVEQAAQTAQMMDEQAKELGELISFFKVGAGRERHDHAGEWEGQERRGPNRPWSNRNPSAQTLDFATARTKHLLWKTRLRAYLDGEQSMDESEAVSHRDCDLGHWLYATGLEQFGELPEMKKLEKTHAEMHALIKQVIRSKQAGDTQQAESAYARVERYSEEVVALLKELEKKVKGKNAESDNGGAERPQLKAVGSEEVWQEF